MAFIHIYFGVVFLTICAVGIYLGWLLEWERKEDRESKVMNWASTIALIEIIAFVLLTVVILFGYSLVFLYDL